MKMLPISREQILCQRYTTFPDTLQKTIVFGMSVLNTHSKNNDQINDAIVTFNITRMNRARSISARTMQTHI